GEARPRQNRSTRAFEQTVNFPRLRKVSNLGSAAVISNRRQEVILNHGAQSNIRTESFGLRQRQVCEFLNGVRLVGLLGCVPSILSANQRLPCSTIIMKKKRKRIF